MSPTLKTALLVIDMQNFFAPMTSTALPHILQLSKFFSKNNSPQIFTQHGHPPSDFDEPITNQLVRKWGYDGSLHTDTPDWELMPSIVSLAKPHTVIPKNTYDAFLNTGLEARLRDAGVERVVICGVMTDCCCDTTGRSAFNRGFETWLVSDACGSASKAQHERGVKAWAFGYGDVVAAAEVLKRLG